MVSGDFAIRTSGPWMEEGREGREAFEKGEQKQKTELIT